MIAVDSSALLAILLSEPDSEACLSVLERQDRVLISAGTVAEALIVAGRRGFAEEMAELIEGMGLEVVSVTAATAVRIGSAYARWGRGVHAAALNFGDCFSYAVAEEHRCPLLFVGNDFARTDLEAAL